MASDLHDELLQRVERQLGLVQRARAAFADDGAVQWAAHVRVRTLDRERDLLLGTKTRAAPGLALIDWQSAPLAEVFFGFEEGEVYEVDLLDRVVTGTVLERNLVWFDGAGRLVRLECVHGAAELDEEGHAAASTPRPRPRPRPRRDAGPERRMSLALGPESAAAPEGLESGRSPEIARELDPPALSPGPDGRSRSASPTWRRAETRSVRIPPRPPSDQGAFRSPLEVDLDAAQKRVVDLPSDANVLLLGEAGFGKTTVALHRLTSLARHGGRRFNAAVVVPTEGLRRLTEQMLARRHVPGVDVFTYDAFARKVARRAFVDLPRREGQSQSGAVVRLKRHRALKQVIAEFARARPKPAVDPERPTRSRTLARRADLEHLFGDRAWTRKVVEQSNGEVPIIAVEDCAEHTKIQFLDRAEKEFGHVDAASLVTVDGRKIDEGTPTEDANSIDAEDYAVLFELDRLRSLRAGVEPARVGSYDCIVVDEAQELSSLELSLLGRAVKKGGTLVVAGDAAQKVDVGSDFAGWEQVMADLFVERYERAVLEVSYRCPDEVTSLARAVLDSARPHEDDGEAIVRALHPNALHVAAWLVDALRALQAQDPNASVAVIARTSTVARALYRTISLGMSARLSLGGDFEFRPGVAVTSVPEVKGLEFDHVVVPDADSSTYPAVAEARRALYVALTRATHRLALSAAGTWTPLVPRVPHLSSAPEYDARPAAP